VYWVSGFDFRVSGLGSWPSSFGFRVSGRHLERELVGEVDGERRFLAPRNPDQHDVRLV
jgi:hypothetical protein